jgi:hypothetical protein
MAKSKKQEQSEEDEAAIMERMDEALKRMMNTPTETHEETFRAPGREQATAWPQSRRT